MDHLLELNQLITTDLNTLSMGTAMGLEIESSILQIQDSFFDLEEDKGFLTDKEVDSFIQQLRVICVKIGKQIVVKDLKTLEIQM